MSQKTPSAAQSGKSKTAREDRLKAALKANMARRKAQAKARTESDKTKPEGEGQDDG